MIMNARKRRKPYHKYEYSEGRAIQCQHLNQLRLRTTKIFAFHPKYQISNGCLNWHFEFTDTYDHLYSCKWNGVQYTKDYDDEMRGKGEHLVKINIQRSQQYGEPLFWYGGSKDFIMSSLLDKDEDLYSSKSVERLLNTAHNTFGQGAEVTDVSNEQLFDIENKNRNKKNADFPVGDQEKDENSRTSVMDETQQEGFEPENVMCQGVQKCVSIKSKIE